MLSNLDTIYSRGKKWFLVISLFIAPFLFPGFLSAQSNLSINKDSLVHLIEIEGNDSIRQIQRIKTVQFFRYDPSLSEPILLEGIEEARKNKSTFWEGELSHYVGIMHAYSGKTDSAIYYFKNSLKLRNISLDTLGVASSLQALSNIYKTTGEYDLAITYALQSLNIYDYQKDFNGSARVYNNLGLIFRKLGDQKKSRYYYDKGLENSISGNNIRIQIGILENIGGLFQDANQFDSALVYHQKAFKIRAREGIESDVGQSYGNLGLVYFRTGQLDSAKLYLQKALVIFEETNFQDGIVESYIALGELENKRKNYHQALIYFSKAEQLALASKLNPMLIDIYSGIGYTNRNLGNYKASTHYLSKYIELKDSLFSQEKSAEVQKRDIAHQFRQKELADSLKRSENEKLTFLKNEKEKQLLEERMSKQKQLLYSGGLVIMAVGIFLFVLWKKNKYQKKLNDIILEQNLKAEVRNKEITDSILYAKRIQEATFPHPNTIQEKFEKSFVIYKPKDIVAGDFYWIEVIDDKVFLAVADCTGHGVPGALVSVICSNALNRVVKEFRIFEPGKILDKTKEIVISTFEKGVHDVKDGMDISLCLIEFNTKRIQWAGAHNPLWIQRKNTSGYHDSIEEILPNRQPVGKFEASVPFDTHELEYKKGDRIFMFTDGLLDQFGGPKGKKFKSTRFKELLMKITNRDMRSTKSDILNAFENWKGTQEQIDDLCIVGIEF